jgi:hypothetical protein
MTQMLEQCSGGKQRYGNIIEKEELQINLIQHCIPAGFDKMTADNYGDFLAERRKLMALKIRDYFYAL